MKKNYVIAANCITVGEFKKLIEDLPNDYKLYCCGTEEVYIDVITEDKQVIIDNETFIGEE